MYPTCLRKRSAGNRSIWLFFFAKGRKNSSEKIQQSNTKDRIRSHHSKSDTVFKRGTLSQNVGHCQTGSSSDSFYPVSLYHTVPRARNAISPHLMNVCWFSPFSIINYSRPLHLPHPLWKKASNWSYFQLLICIFIPGTEVPEIASHILQFSYVSTENFSFPVRYCPVAR